MADDPTASYGIYTGVWIDWSRGEILGATLTTTRPCGNLLIALVSLFVTAVGTSFWRIARFVFHCIYSSDDPRDAVYHQRQAVLRNSGNATTGIVSLLRMFRAWRQHRAKKMLSYYILPPLACTLLILAGFAAASTFSSRISTSAGKAVLISSDNCGYVDPEKAPSDGEVGTVFVPYHINRLTSDANYVKRCYLDETSLDGCDKYAQRRLPATITRNATCPFAPSLCKSQDSNIILDTGLLDSNRHFGLNTPPGQSFQLRLEMHCAPLETEGHRKMVMSNLHNPYMRYYYGDTTPGFLSPPTYFTYQHPFVAQELRRAENWNGPEATFDIRVLTASMLNGSLDVGHSGFSPIKELTRPDADTFISFLSTNAVLFTQPEDDLWYPVHRPASSPGNSSSPVQSMPLYWSDEPSSPLACVQRYQHCNPNLPPSDRCTPLLSSSDAGHAATALWKEDREWSRSAWFRRTVSGALPGFFKATLFLGPAALESTTRLATSLMGPLRANQWQVDVEKWFNIGLAFMQQNCIEAAGGPSDSRLRGWLIKPQNEWEKQLCESQKIFSTAYTNFSVLGLATTLAIGGLIIAISYTLEPFVAWIQRRRDANNARHEWRMNETLQLQRLVHEELGLGTWDRCDGDVPVTTSQDMLGVLDMSSPTHPRLMAPPTFLEAEEQVGMKEGGVEEQKRVDSMTEMVVSERVDSDAAEWASLLGGQYPRAEL